MTGFPAQAPLLVSKHEGWTELRLNRPDKLNALNVSLLAALKDELLSACADDRNRLVVLTGEGRGFCVGQDLNERDPERVSWPPDIGGNIRDYYAPIITAIADSSMPVICAVNGVAAGAGANLALACDIVVAKQSAVFVQSFAKIGLMPDAAGSWLLPRLVGLGRAKAIAMLAEPIPADEAQSLGMIWRAVPDAEFDMQVRSLLDGILRMPPAGLSATKHAMNQALQNELPRHLELEAGLQNACGKTEDYRERVTAFLKQRGEART